MSSWMGKAIFYSGTWWRKEYEDSWSAHNVSRVTGQSHCCGTTASQDGTIQERLPEALKSSVRKTNGWSTTHPSCMPTSLTGWVQLLQERTCGTVLAKPHKSQVRPEQQWDPTALCHKTLQRASLLSRRAEWAEKVPQPILREEFHY